MNKDIDDLLPALVALRRDLHAHPELAFEERRTSSVVAAALRDCGLEVHEGIGGTGVVGVLRRGNSTRMVGLRADMDALPMREDAERPYVSRHPGVHHGCGHDGHTAMLLGAAQQLARAGSFDGSIAFIFQPAEEGRGGAREMVRQGLFDRFPCESVFALHNWPDLPAGTAATRPGPIMAAADRFDIVVRGRGGHAAQPDRTPDVVLAASQLVAQMHTIVSRRIPPTQNAVLVGDAHQRRPIAQRPAGGRGVDRHRAQFRPRRAGHDRAGGPRRRGGCRARKRHHDRGRVHALLPRDGQQP